MGSFKYAAKKAGGQTVEGTIQAEDKTGALAELRKQNLVVLNVEAVSSKGGAKSFKFGAKGRKFFQSGPSIDRNELVLFTRQLATMVASGLALLEAIDVLGEQADSKGMRQTCQKLGAELRGGSDLSSAMDTCPRAFNPLYVSMVRAGEASGQMDIILERLADYQEASQALTREIRSAMTYPVISLTLVLGITAFLMIGVVPTFKSVFEGLGAKLPAITEFVLATSDFLRAHWFLMGSAFAGSIFGLMMFKKTRVGSHWFDVLTLKIPVFGPLARKVALARFSRTFATLIRSGVPIMATLEIVSNTAGNSVISNAVDASRESVKNGQLLSDPLARTKVFPSMVVRMIAIGEKTGSLEALLEKIAEFYDAQVKASIKAMTSLIEPILITFMGVIVGGVVLSVFLPILDVVGKLGGG